METQFTRGTNTVQADTGTSSKLKDFFVDQLHDIYWAEKKLVKKLPKLEEAATSAELKQALSNHLQQTRTHV